MTKFTWQELYDCYEDLANSCDTMLSLFRCDELSTQDEYEWEQELEAAKTILKLAEPA